MKYLSAADYDALGAEIVLGNTYHLMLRPGADVVARFGGLGALRRVGRSDADRLRRLPGVLARAEGRRRRRHVPQRRTTDRRTGSRRSRRSPCRSCSVPTSRWSSTSARRCRSPPEVVALAVERTTAWAARARAAHRRDDQSLFGIVQGGTSTRRCGPRAPRAPSTLDFDGYGIGGLSVGETRDEMLPALAAAIAHLPADRPRYLMGVGDPASLVEAVAARRRPVRLRHADPPRSPRHGADVDRQGARQGCPPRATRTGPSTPTAPCEVCARHSRGYLRHLFAVGEPTASRLLSLHNVAWTLQLMDRMRDAIGDGHVRRAAGRGAGGLGLSDVAGAVTRRASSVGSSAGPAHSGADRKRN